MTPAIRNVAIAGIEQVSIPAILLVAITGIVGECFHKIAGSLEPFRGIQTLAMMVLKRCTNGVKKAKHTPKDKISC